MRRWKTDINITPLSLSLIFPYGERKERRKRNTVPKSTKGKDGTGSFDPL
jgi:hypothetical protein